MKIIGLTGGIGSGKSTVSAILKELGAIVIDSDKVAHEVRDTVGKEEVIETFGREILTPQGAIDRKKLARIVFSNPEALLKLNRIVHPKLEGEIESRLKRLGEKGTEVVVIEIPLIGKASWPEKADQIWVVRASRDTILKRLRGRGMSEPEALKRMASQTPPEGQVKRGLVNIDNNGNKDELRAKVEKLWSNIHNKDRD